MQHADLQELHEYAQLEGSELGDYARAMLELAGTAKTSYGANDEFIAAFELELNELLTMFREHCTIVETTEQITVVNKELEWNE